ncbi:ribonuclease HII [Alkalibacter mobilis]|uniref:ribonuclease HII n=1 Tax=Alkalibacter mobilis TaxID=2787712 RepID=UPI00189FDCC7|nr:ribonuclease HII [Alkalibacter mobilis]MBF7095824.1 ribonuclease HII [Alkalibacter mobilis]
MDFKNMSVKAVKEMVEMSSMDDYARLMSSLEKDTRQGVRSIVKSMRKRIEKNNLEDLRIQELKYIEENLHANGFKLIAGMDEVGRGPLAGPVVSCAIMLPIESKIRFVNDSKKLSAEKREDLSRVLIESAISVGLGIIDNNEIDHYNILNSTKKSMVQALEDLAEKPDIILVDAVHLERVSIPQKSFIKGDERCYAIAAASIVAKVKRDAMMDEYHELYPEYNFKTNKGYGTKEHVDAIRKYGLSPVHRKSFCGNFI